MSRWFWFIGLGIVTAFGSVGHAAFVAGRSAVSVGRVPGRLPLALLSEARLVLVTLSVLLASPLFGPLLVPGAGSPVLARPVPALSVLVVLLAPPSLLGSLPPPTLLVRPLLGLLAAVLIPLPATLVLRAVPGPLMLFALVGPLVLLSATRLLLPPSPMPLSGLGALRRPVHRHLTGRIRFIVAIARLLSTTLLLPLPS